MKKFDSQRGNFYEKYYDSIEMIASRESCYSTDLYSHCSANEISSKTYSITLDSIKRFIIFVGISLSLNKN